MQNQNVKQEMGDARCVKPQAQLLTCTRLTLMQTSLVPRLFPYRGGAGVRGYTQTLTWSKRWRRNFKKIATTQGEA